MFLILRNRFSEPGKFSKQALCSGERVVGLVTLKGHWFFLMMIFFIISSANNLILLIIPQYARVIVTEVFLAASI